MPIFRVPTSQTNRAIDRRKFGLCLGGTAFSALLGGLAPQPGMAEEPTADLVSYSREEKKDALRQIPFNQLAAGDKPLVAEVVNDPSIFRRLPVQVVDCDPELYSFLINYPEIVVNIWKVMGITNVHLKRLSPYSFHADDGAGTVTTVRVLYANRDTNVFFADGYYDGPMAPKKIGAQCVLLLRSGFTRTDAGQSFVSNRLDVFVRFDNKAADFLARTLHPLIGKTADYNFAESTKFLAKISKNAEDNFPGMQGLVERLVNVDPAIRQQFSEVVSRVYQRRIMQQQQLNQQLAQKDSTEKSIAPEPPGRFVPATDQVAALPLKSLGEANEAAAAANLGPIPRKQHAELRR